MPPTANELREAPKAAVPPVDTDVKFYTRLADLLDADPPTEGESIYIIDQGLVVTPVYCCAKTVNQAARAAVNPERVTMAKSVQILRREALEKE